MFVAKVSAAEFLEGWREGHLGSEEAKKNFMKPVKMANFLCVTFLVVVVVGGVLGKTEQTCSAHFKGCSIEKGNCVCKETTDCHNPFPYENEQQCLKDIKGELNKCKKEPCVHGQCVQSKHDQSRRWECSCAGSGYYGKKCELKCPPFNQAPLPDDYPTDCIY